MDPIDSKTAFDLILRINGNRGDNLIYQKLKEEDEKIDQLNGKELIDKFKTAISSLIKNESDLIELKARTGDDAPNYWKNLRYIWYDSLKSSFVHCINCAQIFKFDTKSGKFYLN